MIRGTKLIERLGTAETHVWNLQFEKNTPNEADNDILLNSMWALTWHVHLFIGFLASILIGKLKKTCFKNLLITIYINLRCFREHSESYKLHANNQIYAILKSFSLKTQSKCMLPILVVQWNNTTENGLRECWLWSARDELAYKIDDQTKQSMSTCDFGLDHHICTMHVPS